MAKRKLGDREKRALGDARSLIAAIHRRDANEAETRRRVERIFERVMGYKPLEHLSREHAVHGTGDIEHVDFAIRTSDNVDASPLVMVELKRVGVDLTSRHLKQACRYAIDAGCEWVLLTNGREWQLHHVEFGQPPVTKQVDRWDLLQDDVETLATKFRLISLRSLKRGALVKLCETAQVLAPEGLLKAILSRDAIRAVKRVLRRETGIRVKADEIVTALRRMLNESAVAVLEDVEVSLPQEGRGGRARQERRPYCTLRKLVEAGLVKAGSKAFAEYQGQRYEAVVQPDGKMLFEGEAFRSPSAAGGAVTAKHGVSKPNGWTFWQVKNSEGEVVKLAALRKQFAAKSGSGGG
jgi:hypothetical protein